MLKKVLSLVSLLVLFLLPNIAKAEEILSFDVTAKILEDSRVAISERIQYDFGSEERHGIFRTIPYKYNRQAGNYNLTFTDISATDQYGGKIKFSTSKKDGEIVIKIGDPKKTISGAHTYILNYTVHHAINFFGTEDEFYWNVTGNNWPVTIRSASAHVFLPQDVSLEKINLACYVGVIGEDDRCQEVKNNSSVTVSHENLIPKSGITVAVSFPKGLVHEPTGTEKALSFLLANFVALLPVVVLIVLFFRWKKYGKDPAGKGVIISQFDAPDSLTPLEVGGLIDEQVQGKDISAEIINLAVKGYLRINRVEKEGLILNKTDYEFFQLKAYKDLQNEHEKTLMFILFGASDITIKPDGVLLSSFRKNTSAFHQVQTIKQAINEQLTKKGYFRSNPMVVRGVHITIGILVISVVAILYDSFSLIALFSLIISGLLIICFGWIMPAKTKKGVEAKEHILGLKKYLEVAEKDRLEFHNAPEKNPEVFEKLLPFAMVLGVEKQWAKQFENIYISPPSWYGGYTSSHFTAMALTNGLGNFNSNLQSTFISNRSSAATQGRGAGGGGFSGGGFGGGGGGSW